MSLTATFEMEHKDGTINTMSLNDPFREVCTEGVPHARVAITLNSSSKGYGDRRVGVTISLECDQDSDTIDRATSLAFDKAAAAARDIFEEWSK